MAQKTTVTSGPLTDPNTWDNAELPQITDDVQICHTCTLGDGEFVSYGSANIGDVPESCTLQCAGNNGITAGTISVAQNGMLTVSGETTLNGNVRITGQHESSAISVAYPAGALIIYGDVTNDHAASGTICVYIDHLLTITGTLRGVCDAGALICLQGSYGAAMTLYGGIDADAINQGAVISLFNDAVVNVPAGSNFRGERLIDGVGRIQLMNNAISAPRDPAEWYPQPTQVRQGVAYRNGSLTGTYVAQGYPQVHQVLSGVQFGANNERTGTRIDCPAGKALTTASYGNPGSPTVGQVNLDLYVLKTAVVAAANVLRDVPCWTGGTLGTYWPTASTQIQAGVAFGPNGTLQGSLATLDWTDAEKRQIRQALGVDGLKTATAAGNIDAVQAKTDALPVHPAATGDAMTLAAGERTALADALLTRDVAHVEQAAPEHSLCYVVLAMTEADVVTHPGKLTVYRTDGATEFVQKDVTTHANAAPITGVH